MAGRAAIRTRRAGITERIRYGPHTLIGPKVARPAGPFCASRGILVGTCLPRLPRALAAHTAFLAHAWEAKGGGGLGASTAPLLYVNSILSAQRGRPEQAVLPSPSSTYSLHRRRGTLFFSSFTALRATHLVRHFCEQRSAPLLLQYPQS
jgi:hypothetical protein